MAIDTTNPPLPPNAAQEAKGNLSALTQYAQYTQQDLLAAILVELQIISRLLTDGLNLKDDAASYRADPNFPN